VLHVSIRGLNNKFKISPFAKLCVNCNTNELTLSRNKEAHYKVIRLNVSPFCQNSSWRSWNVCLRRSIWRRRWYCVEIALYNVTLFHCGRLFSTPVTQVRYQNALRYVIRYIEERLSCLNVGVSCFG